MCSCFIIDFVWFCLWTTFVCIVSPRMNELVDHSVLLALWSQKSRFRLRLTQLRSAVNNRTGSLSSVNTFCTHALGFYRSIRWTSMKTSASIISVFKEWQRMSSHREYTDSLARSLFQSDAYRTRLEIFEQKRTHWQYKAHSTSNTFTYILLISICQYRTR